MTIITLSSGKEFKVKESVEEIDKKIDDMSNGCFSIKLTKVNADCIVDFCKDKKELSYVRKTSTVRFNIGSIECIEYEETNT